MTAYFGGKRRLGARIASVVVSYETRPAQDYFEPFLGMGGVMRHVPSTHVDALGVEHERVRYGSDAHPDVVGLWQALADGWTPPPSVDKQLYEAVKRRRHEAEHDVNKRALRAFLGFGCSWGARYFGSYDASKPARARAAIAAARDAMRTVRIAHATYDEYEPRDWLIYADPPYVADSGARLNHYPGTPPFDAPAFWQTMRDWSRHNVVLVSERAAPPDFVSVWSAPYVRRFRQPGSSLQCAEDCEHLFMHRPAYDARHASTSSEST